MIYVNLTPHALVVEGVGTFPASGKVARVSMVRTPVFPGLDGGLRVTRIHAGKVEGLPTPIPDTRYLVSGIVLEALKNESGCLRVGNDVFAPDTGADAVRNPHGQIIAVRGLVC